MRISQASEILKIPRYKIDYWRKTGLIGSERDLISFEDLSKLRFIFECRSRNLSLQKIRGYLKRVESNSPVEGQETEEEAAAWRKLRILDSSAIALQQGSSLLHPLTGQYFLNYESREPPSKENIVNIGDINPERIRERELSHLEQQYQDALIEGDDENIESILKKILRIDESHIGALIEYGNIAFEAERLEDAVEYYERALALEPDCVEAIYNLANLYFRMNKYAVSIRHYRRAIELDPEFPESYYNLALLYYSLSYLDDARSMFRYYIQLDYDSDWSRQAEIFIEDIEQRKAKSAETERGDGLFGKADI